MSAWQPIPAQVGSNNLQGSTSFTLSTEHVALKVYCSPHNPGAAELVEELNAAFSTSTGATRTCIGRRCHSHLHWKAQKQQNQGRHCVRSEVAGRPQGQGRCI
eukprot:1857097-Prymnesium_polylepis.1